MVEAFGQRVKHPAFAVFLWGGFGLIVFGALTNPFFRNGAIPGFAGLYGMSFLLFGTVVYLALYAIKWWGKRGLDSEDGRKTLG